MSTADKKKSEEHFFDALDDINTKLSLNFQLYDEEAKLKFLNLDTSVQQIITQQIINYHSIVSEIKSSYILPEERETSLLKVFLRKSNYKIYDDFFQTLNGTDIVEIYDTTKQIQIFRNLNFLSHSSYTIVDMLTTPWPELFHRKPSITNQIMKKSEFISNSATSTQPWKIEPHIVTELKGQERSFLMTLKCISPVFDHNNNRIGWVSSVNVKEVFN